MAEGHIVLNPAVLPGGLCQSEYMDICLAMVRSADAIYLLKGWDVSAGARAEHALAEKLGLTVIYEAPSDTDCRMAAHIYRELVDALRDVAIECHGTDQLLRSPKQYPFQLPVFSRRIQPPTAENGQINHAFISIPGKCRTN
ncbi:DUF4406 domain-containing protein [Escherichia coli]